MKAIETTKPYTLPETASDSALVRCYARDVARWPGLLTGLRRADGSLYVPKTVSKAGPDRAQKQHRSAA